MLKKSIVSALFVYTEKENHLPHPTLFAYTLKMRMLDEMAR